MNGLEENLMALCKCGLSDQYPECNGTHSVTKEESLRAKIIQAYRDWEKENE